MSAIMSHAEMDAALHVDDIIIEQAIQTGKFLDDSVYSLRQHGIEVEETNDEFWIRTRSGALTRILKA